MQCTLRRLGSSCRTFFAPLLSDSRYWKTCPLSTQVWVFQTYKRLSWQFFTEQLLFIYSFFFLLRCVRGEGKGQVPRVCYSCSPGKQTQKYTMRKSLFYTAVHSCSNQSGMNSSIFVRVIHLIRKSPTSKRLDELLLLKLAVQYTRYLSQTDGMTWLIIQKLISLS